MSYLIASIIVLTTVHAIAQFIVIATRSTTPAIETTQDDLELAEMSVAPVEPTPIAFQDVIVSYHRKTIAPVESVTVPVEQKITVKFLKAELTKMGFKGISKSTKSELLELWEKTKN